MVDYGAIVVGLGGAGSSAAYHLSRAGTRVLGLEQFGPMHPHGSSHGRTRIFRTAYHEGAEYVPLVQRAQQLWYELQEATGARIIQKTGGLVIGHRDSPTVAGAVRSAIDCSLKHELLSSEMVQERFPQFTVRESEVALWDPDAGALFPENCIQSYSSEAVEAGAELHYGEAVKRWSAASDSVEVRTEAGEYRARSLVITAGPWTPSLTSDLGLPLEVERQFVLWFPASNPQLVRPERMPVFIWDRGPEAQTYGLPDFGDGVKVGSWSGKVVPTPERADRVLHETEVLLVRDFVSKSLNGLLPHEREGMTCLFTNSADHNFLIGKHPRHANVVIVSACSGHGFKFASVVGELIGRLVRNEEPGYDLSRFDVGRFGAALR
jgi:sarcosine oxidase